MTKCDKLKYFSYNDAKYAIKQLKHTGVKRAYKCEPCGELGMGPVWHLTSKEGKYYVKEIKTSNR